MYLFERKDGTDKKVKCSRSCGLGVAFAAYLIMYAVFRMEALAASQEVTSNRHQSVLHLLTDRSHDYHQNNPEQLERAIRNAALMSRPRD